MADETGRIDLELENCKKELSALAEQNSENQQKISELENENAIFLSLSPKLEKDETIKAIRILFQTRFKFDQFAILLNYSQNNHLTVHSSFGLDKKFDGNNFEIRKGLFGEVVRKKEFAYLNDLAHENRHDPKFYFNNQTGSFLCIPLYNERQRAFGILTFYRKKVNGFSDTEINYLSRLTHRVSSIIYKTIIYQHTKELSITDPLTGIFNRRYFDERYEREVQRARRYKRPLTVLMIDIDHFKIYNDTLGHLMGDEVLKKVAGLLEANLRRVDFLARYGGEEFVTLLPEIDHENGLIVAEKLRKTIEQNYFMGEEELPHGRVTISVGLASFPDDGKSSEDLLELADKGLYKAKFAGRNQIAFNISS